MNGDRKDDKPDPSSGQPSPVKLVVRRRAAGAVNLWALITLAMTVLLVAITIWHLVRRGRLLRDRLGPVKLVRPLGVPEPEVPEPGDPEPS